MKQRLIALGGAKGAGKSQVLSLLIMALGAHGQLWHSCSTSKRLIADAADYLTWVSDRETTPAEIRAAKGRYRPLLQWLGDRWEADAPASLLQTVLFHKRGISNVIIDSVRRQSEYAYLKSQGAHFILVTADDAIRAQRLEESLAESHPTEQEGLAALKADPTTWIIPNNGDLLALREEVQRFAEVFTAQRKKRRVPLL